MRAPVRCLVALLLVPAAAAAQSSDALYTRVTALTGWEVRGYSFDSLFPNTSQWRVPVAAIVPLARHVSLDVSTNYFSSQIETAAGTQTLNGLTDTQVRALYTLTRDRVVTSLSVNLPTGQQDLTLEEFQVAGAIGSNYLSFPVSSVGTGFSATGGVAVAQPAGSWNVGLSGSFRYQGTYTPLADTAQGGRYDPGTEIRVRGGADRLLGDRTRVTLGLTYSTFSTDEFIPTAQVPSTSYKPGPRLIGEFAVARVMGRSTLVVVLWDYYRTAGRTNGSSDPRTKENILNGEVRLSVPVARRVQVEPLVGFRQYSVNGSSAGRLLSGALTGKVGLSNSLSGVVRGTFDTGWVASPDVGRSDLTGYGFTAFLRYSR